VAAEDGVEKSTIAQRQRRQQVGRGSARVTAIEQLRTLK
jgi:hypothetical protein